MGKHGAIKALAAMILTDLSHDMPVTAPEWVWSSWILITHLSHMDAIRSWLCLNIWRHIFLDIFVAISEAE